MTVPQRVPLNYRQSPIGKGPASRAEDETLLDRFNRGFGRFIGGFATGVPAGIGAVVGFLTVFTYFAAPASGARLGDTPFIILMVSGGASVLGSFVAMPFGRWFWGGLLMSGGAITAGLGFLFGVMSSIRC